MHFPARAYNSDILDKFTTYSQTIQMSTTEADTLSLKIKFYLKVNSYSVATRMQKYIIEIMK